MHILGLSAYAAHSAACLVTDGRVTAAVEEASLSGLSEDARVPLRAIESVLHAADILPAELGAVVIFEQPAARRARAWERAKAYAPEGYAVFAREYPRRVKESFALPRALKKALTGYVGPVLYQPYHEALAAAAFFPSPFAEAAVLVLDDTRSAASVSAGTGAANQLTLREWQRDPHGLDAFAAAFAHALGFRGESAVERLADLAAWGEPRFADAIRTKLLHVRDDGGFTLGLDAFSFHVGDTPTRPAFHALLGQAARAAGQAPTQADADIAASALVVLEGALLGLLQRLRQETRLSRACLVGRLFTLPRLQTPLRASGLFDELWVQPAHTATAGALGAALGGYYRHTQRERPEACRDVQTPSQLGPGFSDEEADDFLYNYDIAYEALDEPTMIARVVERLEAGALVGFAQGRQGYGPAAMGARLILADPRRAEAAVRLRTLAHREVWRPFPVCVTTAHVASALDGAVSPFGQSFAALRAPWCASAPEALPGAAESSKAPLPGVIWPGGRVVARCVSGNEPRLAAVLDAFAARTNTPLLLAADLRREDEPVVCRFEDAYRLFLAAELDVLVLGTMLLERSAQKPLNPRPAWLPEPTRR